jgi:hypothetical protein
VQLSVIGHEHAQLDRAGDTFGGQRRRDGPLDQRRVDFPYKALVNLNINLDPEGLTSCGA